MAALAGGECRGATTCMPSANVMWEGYEIIILISLPNPPPVRAVWVEQPQALRIDSISPTSFWLHLLSTLPFRTLSLAAPHPNLYSSIPLPIHPFHPFFPPPPPPFFALLRLFIFFSPKLLDYTSREHPLAPNIFFLPPRPSSSLPPLRFSQELATAVLFQIIQLLKHILS